MTRFVFINVSSDYAIYSRGRLCGCRGYRLNQLRLQLAYCFSVTYRSVKNSILLKPCLNFIF